MAAIHLLRSQISRLYSSKFKFLRPSINPNFSLQFRPIHSIIPKSSPAEPTSESIPADWRTFSNSQSKPTDSISNGGAGSKNQHHQNPKNQQFQYHQHPKNQQYQHHQNPNNQQYQYNQNPKNQQYQHHQNPKNQQYQHHQNPKNQRNQDHPNPKNQRNQDHPNPKNQRNRNQDYQNLKNKRNQHRQNPKNKHNQDHQNPIFSRHFHPIHSLTPKLSPQSNAHSKPTNSTNSIKSVGSSGEEGRRNLSLVSEQMVGHSVRGHPITPKSFPETPLIDVNGASEEPISEPSPRRWSTFSSPLSNTTNSIKGVGSSGEEGSRIRVNLSLVSGNETSENMMKSSSLPEQMVGHNAPVRLMDVNPGINHMEGRIRLSGLLGLEVNRLLGGGVVPGSLILVGGDPGVGKSTLALQIAALIAASCDVGGAAPVLYISGEESVMQIRNRADQLSIDTADLFLYSSTVIEDILEKVQLLSPRALVVDSIQSVYLNEVAGSPGGLMQVKECTSALLRFAKKTNIPVLLIGHVTKNGEIAGHEGLEHIVDVVLYMEGEKHPSHRLLRSVKNRFGSTDELGVFEMSESGLEAVSNPSEMFLSEEHSDSDNLVGLAVAVIIDGSRSFLVKVQALCVSGPDVSKLANGVQLSRVGLILSVLKNQLGLKLGDHSIFLNVLSGVSLTETSGDLAVAVAICSSFLEFPLPNRVAFIGEIGLGGELLMVPRIEKRVITLAKLGYKKCVVPESAGKALEAISSEIQIVGCKNLKEVIDKIFKRLD